MSLARPERFPPALEKLPLGELLGRLKDKLKDRPRGWPRALAGLGGRRSGKPAACTDCLRGTTLYYGDVALCDHCARLRALEALTNAKENAMTTEYAEYTQEEIEAELVARTHHYILERNLDPVRDYGVAHHAVLDDDPALKLAYFEGQVIGGPQVQYRPSRGEQLIRDLKTRYGRYGPTVVNAPTLSALVRAIENGVRALAERLGRDADQAWEETLAVDKDLAASI